jgi:YidC/Oxa1 family membrane protein insertase
MQGNLAQILKVALPSTSFVFVYFQPGAVQLFFATGALLSLCQTTILQNKVCRRWLGLLPFPPKAVASPSNAVPAGLKTWQDINASRASESQTKASKNISIIDRYVDAAKGRYTNMTESVLGKTEDRQAARKKENFILKAEKYELSRRQQAEWEREIRNKNRTVVTSSSKSGRDVTDELVDEEEDRSRTTASKSRKRQSTGVRR